MNTSALEDTKRLLNKLLLILYIRAPRTSSGESFPELGEGSEPTIYTRSILRRSFRETLSSKLLQFSKNIRKAVRDSNRGEMEKYKPILEKALEWFKSAISYGAYKRSKEEERGKVLKMQVKLFKQQYDAIVAIEENWELRYPGYLSRKGKLNLK